MTPLLLAADLHNHSLFSDGEGDPRRAFAQLRQAGLDVAALTDHASIPAHVVGGLRRHDYPSARGFALVRTVPSSLDASEWSAAGRIADAYDEPGSFTALRGFEWTEPWIGHVNVWFSDAFLPVTTPGTVAGLHQWLVADEPGALFGYNHPGREEGRFDDFALAPALVQRMVSLEMFNRFDDYVAVGVDVGRASPLLQCLRAGWRPGLAGVSDEHGRHYGLRGKGRTGLWCVEHSRAGVREALSQRRMFATREVDLRLDATLGGVSMGQRATPEGVLRIDLGVPDEAARGPVHAQLLVDAGDVLPDVVAEVAIDPHGISELDLPPLEDHDWVVLRIVAAGTTDPSVGLPDHPLGQRALAYASPWWLR